MKKLITILAFAIAIPSMLHAQGTVNFSSTSANMVIKTNGVSVASGFATVGLYYGAVGTADVDLVLISPTVLNGAGGGIGGGTRTTGNDVAAGAQGVFQVRAWTGGFATYAAAVTAGTGLIGSTTSFVLTTGNPNGSPPTVPVNMTGWTVPISLVAVPEPSTIALGVLGAGSLLFLRRKK